MRIANRGHAIALLICVLALGIHGCTKYSPATNSPVSGKDMGTGALGTSRGIGAPDKNAFNESLFVERALLYPGESEVGDNEKINSRDSNVLFVYLLIRPAADQDKRIEALRAYSCYVPSRGSAPTQSNKAVFFVPARVMAGSKLNEHDRNKLFQDLANDGYDYDRANKLIWEVGRWSNSVPNARGIFIIEVDRPIPMAPTRGQAYDLAGLPADLIRNWIINEVADIEGGWSTDKLSEIHRAIPSWPDVISSLHDVFKIVPASNASPAQAWCP
jgi:hypothetical protein